MSRNIPYGYDQEGNISTQWVDQYHEENEE